MKPLLLSCCLLISIPAICQWVGPDETNKIYYSKGYVGIGGFPVHRFHLKSYDDRPLLFAETPLTSLSYGQEYLQLRAKAGTARVPYIEWFAPSGNRQAYIGMETSVFGLTLDNGFNFSIKGGNVGIGTDDPKGYQLAVAGKAIAEEIVIKLNKNWPDYVFDSAYHLPPLPFIRNYIAKYHRLPDVPSATEVSENGMNVSETSIMLLQKVEELTLYALEADARLQVLGERIAALEKELESRAIEK